MPILEAIAVTVLVYYTAAKFLVPRNTNATSRRLLWIAPRPFYREVPTSSGSESPSSGGLCTFAVLAGAMAAVCGVLAAPTAYLARIVYFEGKSYCEVDLSPMVSSGGTVLQTAVSLYYLAYSAVLSYWLPLLVSGKYFEMCSIPSSFCKCQATPHSSKSSKRLLLTPPLHRSEAAAKANVVRCDGAFHSLQCLIRPTTLGQIL